MNDSFSDIDLEIDRLLSSMGTSEADCDSSPTIKPANLDTDYDGTPIIGTEKKKTTPKAMKELKEKKSGRGRPQDKTFTCAEYSDVKVKLGIILSVLYKQFGQENITFLQSKNLFEIVILDSDGYSKSSRVRFYIGCADKNAHGRDKCKGRVNVYERKGVFPIVDLVGSVRMELERIGIK